MLSSLFDSSDHGLSLISAARDWSMGIANFTLLFIGRIWYNVFYDDVKFHPDIICTVRNVEIDVSVNSHTLFP
jgi:hypothetical protein